MSGGVEQRLGHNESLFREINERIEAGSWPGEESERVAFLCECGMLGCNLLVEVSLREYEEVRASPRQFIVVPGHEVPGIEAVVRREPGFIVVEKLGRAGAIAENSDPREE
jgi:hypothetical protein